MKKFITIATVMMLSSMMLAHSRGRVVTTSNPAMTVYLPAAPASNGRAIIACPGGGYSHLAKDHEGHLWAHFFNNLGIAYAVLEYNMPKGDGRVPVGDVEKAFELLADSASVWKINPDNIGIMGSSAGGPLASTVSTHPTEVMKPAFQVLFYPVISLDSAITHQGTRRGFLGDSPSEAMVKEFSSDCKVSESTPRAFIALSADDRAVVPENSIRYFSALSAHGVPAAMFIYPTGGHGWGYRSNFKYHSQVLEELRAWLDSF